MSKSPQRAAPPDIIDAIRLANAGRDPERLAMKYNKMTVSPFAFLRGACHLFYDSLPDSHLFRDAPLTWCCGDLHFENFGSYKGDNRLVYFDINDFDEAALAPATWDMVRLLTSLQCGAAELRSTPDEARTVSQACLDAYRQALIRGKPLWVERETSSGLVNTLLSSLQKRDRAAFLDRRTVRQGAVRKLKLDSVKALPASAEEQRGIIRFVAQFAATQPDPKFYEVRDVARRIAGTGSLGVMRFVVLVEGKGSPDGNYLLDIKHAKPSALLPLLGRLGIRQPAWPDEASRVVTIQKRMQAIDHAFLQPVTFNGLPCILKGLQPSEDRVAIGDWGKKPERLREVAATMGRLLAWDQLRATGRSGSASADELIAFARRDDWASGILTTASEMAESTRRQWQIFVEAVKRWQLI
jgi:uncharacterized protein (DUF2252 family)